VANLPEHIKAVLFDLDGVLTDTAKVHAKAWKATFDDLLRRHGDDRPFDVRNDYTRYVDGKSRADGVRSFLESRGIDLPEGCPDDPPEAATVNGVGNRKNEMLLDVMKKEGVEAYPGSVQFLDDLDARGIRKAVVSSSANAKAALEAAGIADRFDARVDGVTLAEEGLRGKPAPDTFLRAAELLRTPAQDAAVVEDALAGVQAGRAGDFGLVIGVNRNGQAEALSQHGADIVVDDLSELRA
jgi:beta-phosphoglucomutase family hydrolase